jgi:hypothetical protein
MSIAGKGVSQLLYFDGFAFTIHSAMHWLEGIMATKGLRLSAGSKFDLNTWKICHKMFLRVILSIYTPTAASSTGVIP